MPPQEEKFIPPSIPGCHPDRTGCPTVCRGFVTSARLPSRLTSMIRSALSGLRGLLGCAVRPAMPPSRNELSFFGLNGS